LHDTLRTSLAINVPAAMIFPRSSTVIRPTQAIHVMLDQQDGNVSLFKLPKDFEQGKILNKGRLF